METTYTFDDIQLIPKFSEIESRGIISLETQLTSRFKLGIPYVSAPMDTVTEQDMAISLMNMGGLGVIHRFLSIEEQANNVETVFQYASSVMDSSLKTGINYSFSNDALSVWTSIAEIPIAAAVGVTGDYVERAVALYSKGANVILIDVAHGNTIQVKNAIEAIRNSLGANVDIIAGNVATKEGAMNLVNWGVDAIRCGIGGGSLCETRIRTGVGIPQATAIQWCVDGIEATKEDVYVIADGGIRMPGDVAKALSLGASTVMIGSLFAGTRETPGEISKVGQWPNESLYKKYHGSASADAKRKSGQQVKNVEGNAKLIPYKGKVARIVDDINDGLRSAMSYVNAENLEQFYFNSEHVIITQNGLIEAKPHLL